MVSFWQTFSLDNKISVEALLKPTYKFKKKN